MNKEEKNIGNMCLQEESNTETAGGGVVFLPLGWRHLDRKQRCE